VLPDVEAFASEVAHTINQALTPVLERLAAAEARLQVLGDVRDRVVTIEAKAAVQPQPAPHEPPRVDLTPVMERLASADTRLARLAGLETTVGELRDRVLTMEAKADTPPVEQILQSGPSTADLELHIKSALEPITKHVSALQERIAVMEVRAQVPGPAGKDGLDGKAGADGMGWDDLAVKHDGERSFTVEFVKGERVKTAGTFVIPAMIYRGVYQERKSYELGDTVTFGNQMWHCHGATDTPPGEGSKFWQLCVRKGRDGRDGKDAVTVPVVSVGRTQ